MPSVEQIEEEFAGESEHSKAIFDNLEKKLGYDPFPIHPLKKAMEQWENRWDAPFLSLQELTDKES
jgi:hypothetical protein